MGESWLMRLRWKLGRCPWCWRRHNCTVIASNADEGRSMTTSVHVPHCDRHGTEAEVWATQRLTSLTSGEAS